MSFIDIKNLRKNYPKFELGPLDLTVRRGSITGFIGINGSGKTTTIKSILNLVKPNSGNVQVFGQNIYSPAEKNIKNRLGVILDEGYFYENLTIAETEKILGPIYTTWSPKRFAELCETFDLERDKKISQLSKGMRMKLSIALGLAKDSEGLIMDEPTSGLDPLIREKILLLMQEYMTKTGRSVLFSTHITSDLDKIAENIVLIDDGKILFSGSKNNFIALYHKVIFPPDQIDAGISTKILAMSRRDDGRLQGFIANEDKKKMADTQAIDYLPSSIEDIMLLKIKNRSEAE